MIQDVIEKYVALVHDYFTVISESEAVQSSEHRAYIVQLGLNAITHIYKLAFFSSKHLATTVAHTQKGIYCFIEYIDQTYKLGTPSSVDYMDALAFIYDKALTDLCVHQSAYNNMLSVSAKETSCKEDTETTHLLFARLSVVASAFCWVAHPGFSVLDQRDLVSHLAVFLLHVYVPYHQQRQQHAQQQRADDDTPLPRRPAEVIDAVCMYLETVQEKISLLSKAQYVEILANITKHMKRSAKRKDLPSLDHITDICLHLGVHYDGKTLQEIASDEGWKKPAEDLVKSSFR
jgi:hypothetical protein